MAHRKTVFLPIGYTLTLTTDDMSSGTYTRLGNPGGTVYTPADLSVSSTVILGPFNEPRDYALDILAGDMTYTMVFSGVFSSGDESSYVKFTDLGPQTAIDDLADDADGTAIALAVNSIIAALVEAGILEEAV